MADYQREETGWWPLTAHEYLLSENIEKVWGPRNRASMPTLWASDEETREWLEQRMEGGPLHEECNRNAEKWWKQGKA